MRAKQSNENREELIAALTALKEKGYKNILITAEDDYYTYAVVTTPHDNVMYIQRGNYNEGWEFSLQYHPNKNTGSGCMCFEKAVPEITHEILSMAEDEGRNFARRLKAKLYASSKEFYDAYWNRNRMISI